MEMNFCRRCGKRLTHERDHVYKCIDGHILYANHSPAVGIFFVSEDNRRVLFIVRGSPPGKGMLGIPGGFLDAKESFEAALEREIREEVGLSPEDYGDFAYVTSQHDTYIYGGEPVPVITCFFWARLRDEARVRVADNNEVEAVDWYPIDTMDLDQIYAHDIRVGLSKLRKLIGSAN